MLRGPNTITGDEWLRPQQSDQALWQGWDGVEVGVELEVGHELDTSRTTLSPDWSSSQKSASWSSSSGCKLMSVSVVFGKLYDFYLFCLAAITPWLNPLALCIVCLSALELILHINGRTFPNSYHSGPLGLLTKQHFQDIISFRSFQGPLPSHLTLPNLPPNFTPITCVVIL